MDPIITRITFSYSLNAEIARAEVPHSLNQVRHIGVK